MLVFWEQRLAILATPKTGSTAIATALESLAAVSLQRPAPLKHTSVAGFRHHFGPYLAEVAGEPFTLVALMREPRDWLGSWYKDRHRDDLSDPAKSTLGMSFDDFVNAWCDRPTPAFADVGSQADFLEPEPNLRPDRIFRYEDLSAFLHFLEDRLDFHVHLPRINVSPAAPVDLSPRTEKRLETVAVADFQLYGSLD